VAAANPPAPRTPGGLSGYLEEITRVVFQAGINRRVIEVKWPGIRDAFGGFDPARVAALDAGDIDALMADPRVIRNRAKLEATVDNAQSLLELDAEHDGFGRYLRCHAGFEESITDLKRQFRFVGDAGAYYFLYSVGENVPPHQEWVATRSRRHRSRRGTG
jgi:3-methyladenine DNA glycosylase Tag